MARHFEELSNEIEEQVEELIERVLTRGGLELEHDKPLWGGNFRFRMPDQTETEMAMDEAGRDARGGLRDVLTRELLFSRIIMAKGLIAVDEVKMNESMSRRFLAGMQPTMVRVLFGQFVAIREAQSIILDRAADAVKKSLPGLDGEPNGDSQGKQDT